MFSSIFLAIKAIFSVVFKASASLDTIATKSNISADAWLKDDLAEIGKTRQEYEDELMVRYHQPKK